MRIVFYGLMSLLALILGAGAFLYMALPTDFVRGEITSIVRERTGRILTVSGPVSISLYPDVTVDLADVTLSPPEGMRGEAFLTVRTLGLKVPLWPLLRQQLIVERFILDQPVISFRTDKTGRRSWDFGSVAEAAGAGAANDTPALRGGKADAGTAANTATLPASKATSSTRTRVDALAGLQLGDVRINHGTLHVTDDRTGASDEVTDISLQLALASLKGAVKADGSLTWMGEPIALNTEISPAEGLLTGAPVTTTAALHSSKADGTFKGRLGLNEPTLLVGKLDLKTGSLRELLRWLRHALPPGPGFGAATISADIGVTAKGLKATNVAAVADGMTAKGSLAFEQAAAKPMLTADLSIDRLDLNTYLPPKDGAPKDAGTGSAPATAAVPAPGKDASKPEPEAPAANDPATGWSAAPINVSALRLADAELALTLGALQFQSIKVGRSVVAATLKDGSLHTRFSELALYGGKGSGTVVVDGSKPAPRIDANFALKSVQVQPLLLDAAGLNRLAGRGNLTFAFVGSGRSQRDIVRTLMGQGRMELADGSVIGYDVPQMVRGLQNGNLGNWQDNPAAKTAFSSLTASSTITNGIMASDDLNLVSPALHLTGGGKADLPARTLDYTLKPQILAVADTAGDATATDAPAAELAPGLSLPVRVTGPWAHPKIAVDLGAIAKNPAAAVNAVKQALGKIKGGDKVQEAVAKLAASKEGKAIGDLLGGLLGKKPAGDAATGIGLQAEPVQ